MLTGLFSTDGRSVHFVEKALRGWSCRSCKASDRLFFVVTKDSWGIYTTCIPCVSRNAAQYPPDLIKKLVEFS
jgi:hypothetical protein